MKRWLRARFSNRHCRWFLQWGTKLISRSAISWRTCARQHSAAVDSLSGRLARVSPTQLLRQLRELLEQERARLVEQMKHQLRERRNRFEGLEARLRLLSPEQVVARGYSITTEAETGK